MANQIANSRSREGLFGSASRPDLFNLVRVLLGAILILAAALKAEQWLADPSAPAITLGFVALEFALGVWLFLGRAPRASWLAATVCFAIFAVVAGYKIMIGQEDCGCFGKVSATPWQALTIDLVALLALFWCRRSKRAMASPPTKFPSFARVPTVGLLLFAVWSYWSFGSLSSGIAYASGFSVVAEVATISVGEVPIGTEKIVAFRIRNLTSNAVQVVGAKSSCGCYALDDLPLTLKPNQNSELRLRFRPKKRQAGKTVVNSAMLYLDVESPPVVLRTLARIVSAKEKG